MNKTVSRIAVMTMLMAGVLSLESCTKDEPVRNTVFSLSNTALEYNGHGGSDVVYINTDFESVTCTSSESWCSAVLSDRQDTLTVSVTSSTSKEPRTAIVTVTAAGGDITESATVSVTQDPLSHASYIDISSLDFTESDVLVISEGTDTLAYVCREYILSSDRAVDTLRTVVYPVSSGGRADLTAGMELGSGAAVRWEKKDTTDICTVTGGSSTPERLFFEKDKISVSSTAEVLDAVSSSPFFIIDKRGTETFSYPTVKIGTLLWSAKNLKATKYLDGSAISTSWLDAGGSYKCYFADDQENEDFWQWGNAYNGYAVTSPKGLAPSGWAIPSASQWKRLYNYLTTKRATKIKSALWTCQNDLPQYMDITGLGIDGGYLVRPTGAWYDEIERVNYWTSDTVTNGNGKQSVKYIYLAKSSVNSFSFQNEYVINGMDYGCYVRCVKSLL